MPRITQTDQLTPAQLRCLTHLADGLTHIGAAHALRIKVQTFRTHMLHIRNRWGHGSSATLVHRAYATGQMALPDAVEAPAVFDAAELRLWNAVAEHPSLAEIAIAVGMVRGDARKAIYALLEKAGAKTESHLIKLGYAYRVLPGPGQG
ncbi:hypothetical protein [Streptomyces sp. Ac-502]|uniref:helix-turn-helix transcriptional regulator n=1 Tax=Streptomyces sp. Ac-502 TaxID=3342801 RepID=UPI003862C56D